jgi:hypothetical protein
MTLDTLKLHVHKSILVGGGHTSSGVLPAKTDFYLLLSGTTIRGSITQKRLVLFYYLQADWAAFRLARTCS